MSFPATRRLFAIALFLNIAIVCHPQPDYSGPAKPGTSAKTEPRPFKLLTTGRQITIKSVKNIQSVMVWTSGGHRIIEQKAVNASSYSFNIIVNEKIFFMMVQFQDGKIYTEKIGIN